MNSLQPVIFLLLLTTAITYNPIRVCYYTNWSQYRHGIGKFMPSDIDPQLCTHLVYAFAKLGDNHELTFFEWNDETLYEQFNGLKKQNPNLKTLIATGGWTAGSKGFSDMVTDDALRKKFVRTSVKYVRDYGFDGLDMDWEYPALKDGSRDSDKVKFITLLKELQDEIATDADNHPYKPKLLLTAAVAAGKSNIVAAYNISEMSKYLDFICLMSYDLHGSWESVTGHNSPLYARSGESDETFNIDWAARYWVTEGTPNEKLIIGLATYGRHFQLTDPRINHIGAATSAAGKAGTYTAEAGFLAYYEICSILLHNGATRFWQEEQKVPYVVDGNQWIGYDDVQSLTIKLNYIKDKGYGGAMVWSLALDDFRNNCTQSTGKYPLTSLMATILGGYIPPSTVSPPSTKMTSTDVTTGSTGSTKKHTGTTCVGLSNGFYPNQVDCSLYYQCWSNTMYPGSCEGGLMWNQALKVCDYSYNVNCSESTTEATWTGSSASDVSQTATGSSASDVSQTATSSSTSDVSQTATSSSTSDVSQTTVDTPHTSTTAASCAIKPQHIIIIVLWISVHAAKCT